MQDMKTYIGTKTLRAVSMTRGDYNELRGWPMPANEEKADAGYLVEYADGGQANHQDFKGYISWSPAGVFERSYKPAETWLDRLRIERDELSERLEKLQAFVEAPAFEALDDDDAELLLNQRMAMSAYLHAMNLRIEKAGQ